MFIALNSVFSVPLGCCYYYFLSSCIVVYFKFKYPSLSVSFYSNCYFVKFGVPHKSPQTDQMELQLEFTCVNKWH